MLIGDNTLLDWSIAQIFIQFMTKDEHKFKNKIFIFPFCYNKETFLISCFQLFLKSFYFVVFLVFMENLIFSFIYTERIFYEENIPPEL